jgi:type II secretion system protein N
MFLIGGYCSFPKPVVREMAESSITFAAFGLGPTNRGVPKVSIKDVSLWRLSGMDLSDIKVVWPGNQKELPLNIDIDRLKARLAIFAAMSGQKNLSAVAKLYGGSLESDVFINKQNALTQLEASLNKLDLGKINFLSQTLGAALQGLLSIAVDIKANSQLSKDGAGNLEVSIERGVFGPGNISLPEGYVVPSLSVPQISLGQFNAKFTLDKGMLESKGIKLSGGDLESEMQLSVALGRVPQISRVNGRGWFSLKKEFINGNETIQTLYDLMPELRSAYSGDGKVGFMIRGTVSRPMFRLEQYVAQRAPDKAMPNAKP